MDMRGSSCVVRFDMEISKFGLKIDLHLESPYRGRTPHLLLIFRQNYFGIIFSWESDKFPLSFFSSICGLAMQYAVIPWPPTLSQVYGTT